MYIWGDFMAGTSYAKIISVFLAIACIFGAISSVAALVGDLSLLSVDKEEYDGFNASLTELDNAVSETAKQKDAYEKAKAEYDKTAAEYELSLMQHEADVKEYELNAAEYNQNLLQYTVGMSTLGSGQSGIDSGKLQLEYGFGAYEQGRDQFEQGKAEFEAQKAEFEQGRQMYELGLSVYNDSLESYNAVLAQIAALEDGGMSHEDALKAVSESAGMQLSDETLAQTASSLSTAKLALDMLSGILEMAEFTIPSAEAQLDQGERQLDELYAQLLEAKSALAMAEAQLAAGKNQLNTIGSELYGTKEGLIEAAALIAENEEKLLDRKAELDSKAEGLSDYESMQKLIERSHSRFVGMGLGSDDDEFDTLLAAAHDKADAMHGDYVSALSALIISVATLFAAVILYFVFSSALKKRIDRRTYILASVIAVCALVSAVAAAIDGEVGTAVVVSAAAVAIFAASELPAMKKDAKSP